MTRRRVLAGAAGALALVGIVIALAISRDAAPTRCADGMIALGARCCGEGQTLDGDRCVGPPRRCAHAMKIEPEGCVAIASLVHIEGGRLRVGPGDWEAQGVVTAYEAEVEAFDLEATEVTESRYAECVGANACAPVSLSGEPGRAVSGVTRDEAARFCAWAHASLPTSDQLAFASAGPSGRRYPWGDTGAVCRRVAWGLADGPCAHGARGPELAGSHPDGASPSGALDLAGNVAEWGAAVAGRATGEVRGGSWADGEAAVLRSWHRREIDPATRSSEIGFRCAQSSSRPDVGSP